MEEPPQESGPEEATCFPPRVRVGVLIRVECSQGRSGRRAARPALGLCDRRSRQYQRRMRRCPGRCSTTPEPRGPLLALESETDSRSPSLPANRAIPLIEDLWRRPPRAPRVKALGGRSLGSRARAPVAAAPSRPSPRLRVLHATARASGARSRAGSVSWRGPGAGRWPGRASTWGPSRRCCGRQRPTSRPLSVVCRRMCVSPDVSQVGRLCSDLGAPSECSSRGS